MHEQRITARLHRYWDMLRATADMPLLQEFRTKDLRQIWDNCFLLEVDTAQQPPVITYRHIGNRFLSFYGMSVSRKGEEIYTQLVQTYEREIPQLVLLAAEGKAPVYEDKEVRSQCGEYDICYRMAVYPLADAQGRVAACFGGMRWTTRTVRREF
jgi:hypothetical protein